MKKFNDIMTKERDSFLEMISGLSLDFKRDEAELAAYFEWYIDITCRSFTDASPSDLTGPPYALYLKAKEVFESVSDVMPQSLMQRLVLKDVYQSVNPGVATFYKAFFDVYEAKYGPAKDNITQFYRDTTLDVLSSFDRWGQVLVELNKRKENTYNKLNFFFQAYSLFDTMIASADSINIPVPAHDEDETDWLSQMAKTQDFLLREEVICEILDMDSVNRTIDGDGVQAIDMLDSFQDFQALFNTDYEMIDRHSLMRRYGAIFSKHMDKIFVHHCRQTANRNCKDVEGDHLFGLIIEGALDYQYSIIKMQGNKAREAIENIISLIEGEVPTCEKKWWQSFRLHLSIKIDEIIHYVANSSTPEPVGAREHASEILALTILKAEKDESYLLQRIEKKMALLDEFNDTSGRHFLSMVSAAYARRQLDIPISKKDTHKNNTTSASFVM